MSAKLLVAIVMERDLVAFRQLEGQPQCVIRDVLIVYRLGTVRGERVAQIIVRAPTPEGVEEPQPVPLDRAA